MTRNPTRARCRFRQRIGTCARDAFPTDPIVLSIATAAKDVESTELRTPPRKKSQQKSPSCRAASMSWFANACRASVPADLVPTLMANDAEEVNRLRSTVEDLQRERAIVKRQGGQTTCSGRIPFVTFTDSAECESEKFRARAHSQAAIFARGRQQIRDASFRCWGLWESVLSRRSNPVRQWSRFLFDSSVSVVDSLQIDLMSDDPISAQASHQGCPFMQCHMELTSCNRAPTWTVR